MYGAASAVMSRWCSCFLENDRTTRKRQRKRNALVSALAPLQATIYRFAIYYRPLLSSLLCLSLSYSFSFFFVNSAYMHTHPCSPIVVIAPCFANAGIHVQMKWMMTAVPLYKRETSWSSIYIHLCKKKEEKDSYTYL